MKRLFHSSVSWWLATMTPVNTSLKTLDEREYERKRRLLGALLLFALILTLVSTPPSIFAVGIIQTISGSIEVGIVLLALWLNRQGYLRLASSVFFISESFVLLLGAHLESLSSPLTMLWAVSPIPLLLAIAGLFLPAWIIMLMAVVENLMLFWYYFVIRYNDITHLLSAQERWTFVTYLICVISVSAMIGIFYTLTTKKALLQADRAAELEQTHEALTTAYTSLEVAHTIIQKQALTDGLTGLPNHRAIMDQLEKELDRARRFDRPLSLVFFDADRFKQVNDTHGHAVGDIVLHQIGERATSVMRGGDTLGRFGGEEFVLLLPEADANGAKVVAERLRSAIASEPVATDAVAGGLITTVSIGIATYPADAYTQQDLLLQADQAMYLGKRLGRNQVRTATEARQMSADLELMALLQQDGDQEVAEREGVTLDRLREIYTMKMIYSLLALLEHRDQDMSNEAHAVSDLATAIAQSMHLEYSQVSRIGMAALLHDIGKVGIPDLLLQKTGPLSTHERVLFREHPELGAQILEASPFLHDLVPAVLHHHERWDGLGYPNQLAGEDIPLAARIIAVAEAYDAIQANPLYQNNHSAEQIMTELQRNSGTQFDPAVIHSLLVVLTERQQQVQPLQAVG